MSQHSPHVGILLSQKSRSGTSMAPAPTRPRAPTATCTWSRSACSGTRLRSTQTSWCSARSSNTTDFLQVKCLTSFTISCWKFSGGWDKQSDCAFVQKPTTGRAARRWWSRWRSTASGLAWSRNTLCWGSMGIHTAGLLMDTQDPKVPDILSLLLRLALVFLLLYYFCRLLDWNNVDTKDFFHTEVWFCVSTSILGKLAS